MSKNIAIIGSGFSSLAAACYLTKQGNDVTVYEKNSTIGGRARQLKKEGFTFDIGPTWYWMPDVFERFFADFDKKPSDYYELIKLSPAYQVYFGHLDFVTIADNLPEIVKTFESIEKGSGKQLEQFMAEAKSNYDIAIKDLVYRPGESPLELITLETAKKVNQFFSNIKKDVRKRFKNMKLVQILEFPVLFLGAKPSDTPSFYNFMNFADFGLGTWHPKNGMYSVILAMETLAKELGVKIETNSNVQKIDVTNRKATGLLVNNKIITADIILSGADYHHSETLLDEKSKQEIIADIESDFEAAYEGIKNLPLEAKFGVYTAYRYYKKLLKKLQKTPSLEIKNTRIRVSDYQKVELLARCYVKYRLNII